jgi:glycosyltransferase involved in cell wall biosynthesis
MPDNPLISIVLPCHNGEKYLAISIQSCIDQEYQNWELILVDDCSTDNSNNIMREFVQKDSRIRIIENKQNLKLPASLNAGFENAKGGYFTWTSDDNYYHPKCLKTLLETLIQSNSDAVYSGFYRINGDGKITSETHPLEPENMICYSVAGASFLYKRIIHETLRGYDTDMFLIEDYDFWLRTYLHGFKIVTLDTLLYYYRDHDQSLTSIRKKDILKANYKRALQNFIFLNKFPLFYRENYWHYLRSNINFLTTKDLFFIITNNIRSFGKEKLKLSYKFLKSKFRFLKPLLKIK